MSKMEIEEMFTLISIEMMEWECKSWLAKAKRCRIDGVLTSFAHIAASPFTRTN